MGTPMEQDAILHRLETYFNEDTSPFVEQTPPFEQILSRALALLLSQGNDPASPAVLARLSMVDWSGTSGLFGSSGSSGLPGQFGQANFSGQACLSGQAKFSGQAGDSVKEIPAMAADILDMPAFFQGLPKRTIFAASRFLQAVAQEVLDLEELSFCSEETILEALLALKGVGPDTAEAMVLYAFNRPFIPINTGLYRIANRHGGVPESPEREEIRDWYRGFFPEEVRPIRQTHTRLLAVARRFCKTSRALCAGCPLRDML